MKTVTELETPTHVELTGSDMKQQMGMRLRCCCTSAWDRVSSSLQLPMWLMLSLNSWCLCLPNAEITGMYLYAWLHRQEKWRGLRFLLFKTDKNVHPVCVCPLAMICRGQRVICLSLFSSTTWVLATTLRSLALVVSVFTSDHWVSRSPDHRLSHYFMLPWQLIWSATF